MDRKQLFLRTAVVEAATGLSLLLVPGRLVAVLLGSEQASTEALVIDRVAGAAVLAIGIASWMSSDDVPTASQGGLLAGLLVYNAAVSMLLAYAGAALGTTGALLWPTVALHAMLAIWCVGCLRLGGVAARPVG